MSFIQTVEAGIDYFAGRVFAKIDLFGVPVEGIILWLAVPMVFFTLFLGLPQLRAFGHALRLLRGGSDAATGPGAVSHFAALATAVSGTVGLGNIAGVAVAVSVGGPGAAFWMLVIGFFAMALKCAEVTLGLKYRQVLPDGSINGGPFQTLVHGLAARGLPRTGRMLGIFYAVCLLFGCLSLFQVNQSFKQVAAVTGMNNGLVYGVLFSLAVAAVIIGDIKWISRVTSILSPVKSLVYIFGCLAVLIVNHERVPAALALILSEAFNSHSLSGGIIGAFVVGMRRAVYACEAGVGTAVIAHATAKTAEPASEGLVAMLETFLCIFIICSLSAITVVTAGPWQSGAEGIAITSAAFATVASWFPTVLTLAVFLFAYTTMIANGYYGAQAWGFLFGPTPRNELIFKLIFCSIIPLGAAIDMGKIVDFVDAVYFLMAVPNIIGLYFMAGEVRREISGYLVRVQAGTYKNLP
jgi:alanine or glycine:cation symporter, AGCS family